MPPTCIILAAISNSHVQIDQFALPSRGPGNVFSDAIVDSPELIACLPNSSCTATLTRQLKMMNHIRMKPALAPTMVVAMSSPDPTIDAERINPGPMKGRAPKNVFGGSLIRDS